MSFVKEISNAAPDLETRLEVATRVAWITGLQHNANQEETLEMARQLRESVSLDFAKAESGMFGRTSFQSSAPKPPAIPSTHATHDQNGNGHMPNLRNTGTTTAGNATMKITEHPSEGGTTKYGLHIQHGDTTHTISPAHHASSREAAAYLGANVIKHVAQGIPQTPAAPVKKPSPLHKMAKEIGRAFNAMGG